MRSIRWGARIAICQIAEQRAGVWLHVDTQFFRAGMIHQLRQIFADQLREIQRIKSEGDYEAGKSLVETYGVKVDRAMHEEVLARVEPLNIAPYKGFIQPRLVAIEQDGEIVDVKIEPMESFVEWMLESEETYSFLPITN